MSRAWTCALVSILCAAGACADNEDQDEQSIIVIQDNDREELDLDGFGIPADVLDSVREALEDARIELREQRRGVRDRERIRIRIDERSEIRDALSDVWHESTDVLEGAGEVMRELMAQGMTGWNDGIVAFLGPQITIGDSGAGKARDVDMAKDAAGVEEIEVRNIAGRITIVGADEDRIRVQGSIGEDVEELIFEVDGRSAEVRVKVPSGRRNLKIRSELTITVPRRLNVEARTVSGGVEARRLQGSIVELETVSGGVDVSECTGDIEASTTSGGIKIRDAVKSVHAECVSGGVNVSGSPVSVSAESISGSVDVSGAQREVEVSSVSGRLSVAAGALERLDAETVSGGLEFEGGMASGGRFDINTLSGGVRLTFVGDVSAEFDLQSFSGGINIDLPGAPTSAKRQVSFSTGDGRGSVDVEAFSGGIRIGHK